MSAPVYLDYNATAPVRREARAAIAAALEAGGNPSSVHGIGRAARGRVESARAAVARAAGAGPEEVVFLSGGTEANALAFSMAGRRAVVISPVEHDNVLALAWARDKPPVLLPVDADGVVSLSGMEEALEGLCEPAFVSLMLANNETGVIQPVREAAEIVHEHGGLMHTDAVQALGKIPVDFAGLGVDLMSLTAHKVGGPQGTGALIMREGISHAPLFIGGGQEQGRRAGTENVAGIAGFAAAAEAAVGQLDIYAELAELRDGLERRLAEIAPELRFFSAGAPRLPNTSCFALAGLSAEIQVMALDLAGICVSSGAACSSGKVRPSHVLQAIGADEELARSALRISLGWATKPEDIDALIAAWSELYARSRHGAPEAAE
ncbi:MAG: cysteine desulfurase [Sphingomonadales bacterium]|nr:cysteine desulfurase [Sphingomonadales bacterium]